VSRADGRAVVVMGLMGSGKTSVAETVAAVLGRELRDSDPDLKAAHGIDTVTLADTEGVDALHGWEAQHVLRGVAERPPVVVAAAGSTIEAPEVRAALRDDALVIWLDAPPQVLAERFGAQSYRPRFGVEPGDLLREQDARRRPLFAEVADVVLDASASLPKVRLLAMMALGSDPRPDGPPEEPSTAPPEDAA